MIAGIAFYIFAIILLGAATGVVFSKNPVHAVLYLILAFFNGAALFVLLGAEFLAMLLVIVYVGAVAVLFLFVVMMLDISPSSSKKIKMADRLIRLRKGFGEAFRFKLAFVPLFAALVYAMSATDILLTGGEDSRLLVQGVPLAFWSLGSGGQADKSFVTLSWGIIILSFFIGIHVARRLSGVTIIDSLRHIFSALPISFLVGILLMGEFAFLSLTWSSSAYLQQVVSAPIPPADLMKNTQALASYIYRYYIYIFQAAGLILLVAMIGAIVLSLRQKTTLKRQDIGAQISRDPKACIEMTKPGIGEGISHV